MEDAVVAAEDVGVTEQSLHTVTPANLRRELPRIPFATSNPTLSSRAQQDGSLASHPAESRDLLSHPPSKSRLLPE